MDLLEEFRQYLKKQQVSANTCKNYVSDLSTFVDYLKTQSQYFSVLTLPFVLNSSTLNSYKLWLEQKDPLATANRRLSALRKFITFTIETNSISRDYTGVVENIIKIKPDGAVQTLESFNDFLQTHVSDANTIKQYKSDIKDYLQSNKVTEKHFSLKRFFYWKNTTPSLKLPPVHKSFKSTYWLISLGAILIFLSLATLALQNSNGRFRALQRQAILADTGQILSHSFKQVLGSSTIIDPSELDTQRRQDSSSFTKRAWSIFNFLFKQPKLLDPTIE